MKVQPKTGTSPEPSQRLSKQRLWLFRLSALVLGPLLLAALLEAGLRLAGFGYPTSFLLQTSANGRDYFYQNNQFGWRFFGRQMARQPAPFWLGRAKAPGTVRIFVFGESAAFGDPQPRFGLPRMLEAMLSLRYPGTKFEVVNAAMTGINSHTMLPIARDCARAGGDIWVVYMGNNEVVGPFGAGTVFGPAAPPLPVVRASLALRTTRVGQALDGLLGRFQKPPPEKSEWGGMVMFLGHQVRSDDPRLEVVYRNFERNLRDIINAGRNAGAGIVLSTVAVNLRDCAPFASSHRPKLPEPEKLRWEAAYAQGLEAEKAQREAEAAAHFQEAYAIDDSVAELRFRQGRCGLALNDSTLAPNHFRAARDLDTLRFRCDSRLNGLVRETAARLHDRQVLLADSEAAFAQQSPNGLPGSDFFYEHVHLTFEGNYLLARTIAAGIDSLLPAKAGLKLGAGREWPSAAECARRLGWTDWSRQMALSEIFSRVGDPPFTSQLTHEEQRQRLTRALQELGPATEPGGIATAIKATEQALAEAPEDPWLYTQLATLRQSAGDLAGAAAAAERATELLPSSAEAWSQRGLLLAREQKYEPAITALRRAFALDSQDVWSLHNLGQALAKLGRTSEAIVEYRRALAIKPRFGMAYLGLGQVYETLGRTNEARACFEQALTHRINRAAELTTLARFCRSRGWLGAAATNYADALKLNPADAMVQLEAGQTLAGLGSNAQAAAHYREAVRYAPELGTAHYLLGLSLGQQGDAAGAEREFRETVRLMPDLVEARLNLATALMQEGRNQEALDECREALRRSPANALARRYEALLVEKTGGQTPTNRSP